MKNFILMLRLGQTQVMQTGFLSEMTRAALPMALAKAIQLLAILHLKKIPMDQIMLPLVNTHYIAIHPEFKTPLPEKAHFILIRRESIIQPMDINRYILIIRGAVIQRMGIVLSTQTTHLTTQQQDMLRCMPIQAG